MSKKSRQIVVDSSVIVKWLSRENENHLAQADQILQDVQAGKVELFTSELAKFEVGNALLKSKTLSSQQAKQPLATLSHLPIEFRRLTTEQANETYALAAQYHLTYYDATFVALAKQQQAPLVTDNVKHQGKAKGVTVVSLESYSAGTH